MRKSYYPKIAALCITLLLSITYVSNSYAQTNDTISTQIEAENETKNDNRTSHLLIIAISCAIFGSLDTTFYHLKHYSKRHLTRKKRSKKRTRNCNY